MRSEETSPKEIGWEPAEARATRNLPELCTDLFLLISQMRLSNNFGDPETLRRRIADLFLSMEKEGKRLRITGEDIQAAKYVLTALIDETIFSSTWEFKEKWAANALQLEYFGEHLAGEKFYDQLERLRKRSDKVQLLEVYYLCLLLGFKGKHSLEGTQYIRAAVGDVDKDIRRLSGTRSGRLSPNAEIPDDPVPEPVPKRQFPLWIIVTSCLGVALLLFLVLWFITYNDTRAQELSNIKIL